MSDATTIKLTLTCVQGWWRVTVGPESGKYVWWSSCNFHHPAVAIGEACDPHAFMCMFCM
eukprot:23711-Eustigmatos_ZCMA.PRE.1